MVVSGGEGGEQEEEVVEEGCGTGAEGEDDVLVTTMCARESESMRGGEAEEDTAVAESTGVVVPEAVDAVAGCGGGAEEEDSSSRW
jgi:hypothetical protein